MPDRINRDPHGLRDLSVSRWKTGVTARKFPEDPRLDEVKPTSAGHLATVEDKLNPTDREVVAVGEPTTPMQPCTVDERSVLRESVVDQDPDARDVQQLGMYARHGSIGANHHIDGGEPANCQRRMCGIE